MMNTDGKLYLLTDWDLAIRHTTADECETLVLSQWRKWWSTTPRGDGAMVALFFISGTLSEGTVV